MAEEKKAPSFTDTMVGILKEKEFVLHGISITSTTDYFNAMNRIIEGALLKNSSNVDDEDQRKYIELVHQHFNEIKQLRMMYDRLRK